jgi:hypothetical protein
MHFKLCSDAVGALHPHTIQAHRHSLHLFSQQYTGTCAANTGTTVVAEQRSTAMHMTAADGMGLAMSVHMAQPHCC